MIRPLRDYVVIRNSTQEETKTGLFLVGALEQARTKAINKGIVLAVGPQTHQIEPGQEVYYLEGTYIKNGKEVNQDAFIDEEGKEVVILKEKEILFSIV